MDALCRLALRVHDTRVVSESRRSPSRALLLRATIAPLERALGPLGTALSDGGPIGIAPVQLAERGARAYPHTNVGKYRRIAIWIMKAGEHDAESSPLRTVTSPRKGLRRRGGRHRPPPVWPRRLFGGYTGPSGSPPHQLPPPLRALETRRRGVLALRPFSHKSTSTRSASPRPPCRPC